MSNHPRTTTFNFLDLALRTASDKCGTFNVDPDYIHAAMGVADELLELQLATDPVNQCEELVDLAWFAALGISRIPAEFVLLNIFARRDPTPPVGLINYVGDYLGPAKKAFAYGSCKKGWEGRNYEDEFNALDGIVQSVIAAFDDLQMTNSTLCAPGMDLYETYLNRVIDKLRARYPDKFTTDHASNRDLDAERAILEGSKG
jgi:hypothetical protein